MLQAEWYGLPYSYVRMGAAGVELPVDIIALAQFETNHQNNMYWSEKLR